MIIISWIYHQHDVVSLKDQFFGVHFQANLRSNKYEGLTQDKKNEFWPYIQATTVMKHEYIVTWIESGEFDKDWFSCPLDPGPDGEFQSLGHMGIGNMGK